MRLQKIQEREEKSAKKRSRGHGSDGTDESNREWNQGPSLPPLSRNDIGPDTLVAQPEANPRTFHTYWRLTDIMERLQRQSRIIHGTIPKRELRLKR